MPWSLGRDRRHLGLLVVSVTGEVEPSLAGPPGSGCHPFRRDDGGSALPRSVHAETDRSSAGPRELYGCLGHSACSRTQAQYLGCQRVRLLGHLIGIPETARGWVPSLIGWIDLALALSPRHRRGPAWRVTAHRTPGWACWEPGPVHEPICWLMDWRSPRFSRHRHWLLTSAPPAQHHHGSPRQPVFATVTASLVLATGLRLRQFLPGEALHVPALGRPSVGLTISEGDRRTWWLRRAFI